ncbi:MAG: nuclear transport factor 2 family protein [Lysobacterales bacterium]
MYRSQLLLVSLTFLTPVYGENHSCPASFDDAIKQTFRAIKERDLDRYMGTLPPASKIAMILPNGSRWNGRDEVRAGHREWFADPTWTFNARVVQKTQTEHFGMAIFDVSVDRPDNPGSPFLLSMGFAPGPSGCWHLFHDQNTLKPQVVE